MSIKPAMPKMSDIIDPSLEISTQLYSNPMMSVILKMYAYSKQNDWKLFIITLLITYVNIAVCCRLK